LTGIRAYVIFSGSFVVVQYRQQNRRHSCHKSTLNHTVCNAGKMNQRVSRFSNFLEEAPRSHAVVLRILLFAVAVFTLKELNSADYLDYLPISC